MKYCHISTIESQPGETYPAWSCCAPKGCRTWLEVSPWRFFMLGLGDFLCINHPNSGFFFRIFHQNKTIHIFFRGHDLKPKHIEIIVKSLPKEKMNSSAGVHDTGACTGGLIRPMIRMEPGHGWPSDYHWLSIIGYYKFTIIHLDDLHFWSTGRLKKLLRFSTMDLA